MNTESSFGTQQALAGAAAGQRGTKGLAAFIKRSWHRMMGSMLRAHWERETIRELGNLPSHMLKDIGMREDDIRRVARDLAREQADAWARRAQGANGFGD